MNTTAVILSGPQDLGLGTLGLAAPGEDDIVVDISHSGISTGTEKLFWTGDMPPFPGMGYPLVPGYEAVGEVVEASRATGLSPGDRVFVPGANCYGEARGLFGAAARRVVTHAGRAVKIDSTLGAEGALLALAATARHAIAGHARPDLIVGHGVLGRLLARLTVAAGGQPPTVWEVDPARRTGATGYRVIDPASDDRREYNAIYDASGSVDILDTLIGRLAKGGELVLAGFYQSDIRFGFIPAFMREARLRIAAEWHQNDLCEARDMVETGALSLDGLITHTAPARDAATAYPQAFTDANCLKMILDWSDMQ
ncbi:MAG: chlorophyll synthesis pathway protein BchC [Pseudomonadota bacterium]